MKNYTQRRLEEFDKRTDMPERFEDVEQSLYSDEIYPESEYELSLTKLEEFIATSIKQALAEERERVRGILSVENYKLEEWYSSSERPDTLTHLEANQRNMKTRNEIEQLISFPLDKPLTDK